MAPNGGTEPREGEFRLDPLFASEILHCATNRRCIESHGLHRRSHAPYYTKLTGNSIDFFSSKAVDLTPPLVYPLGQGKQPE
jgi:hypothetical protein